MTARHLIKKVLLVLCDPDCPFDFIVPEDAMELSISIDLPD